MNSGQFREAFYADYVSGHQGVVPEDLGRAGLERDIIARLPPDRSAAILDVGCGQGQLVAMLHDRGFSRASGIDASGEQVATAQRLGRTSVRVGDLFATAEAYPGAYDAITAIDVIEHFDRHEIQRVFQAFADLLRPEGRFVFRSPNGGSPYAGRILYGDLTHGVIYTQRSLEQVGHLTGFQCVEVFPVRPSGTSFRRRVRRAAWRVIEAALKAPLVIETGVVNGHVVTQNLIGVAVKADA